MRIIWTDLIYCDTDEWRAIADGLPQCGDVSESVPRDDLQCPTQIETKRKTVSSFWGQVQYGSGYSHDSTVGIKAIVLANGRVGRVCVAKTIRKDFDFILALVTRTRGKTYEPAMRQENPVTVVIDDEWSVKTGY